MLVTAVEPEHDLPVGSACVRVGQDRAPLRAQLAVAGAPGVGVVHALDEGEVGAPRRVGVDTEDGDARRRPRLVAMAEHAQWLGGALHAPHDGQRTEPAGPVPPVPN